MSLILFKYIVPAIIGYTLFRAISGQYSPFSKPSEATRRPRWFLGLWTGISVAAVLVLALNIAYHSASDSITFLITPIATLLGVLLLPGILGFLIYRSSVKRQASLDEGDLLKPFEASKELDLELADNAGAAWPEDHDMTDVFDKEILMDTEIDSEAVEAEYNLAFEASQALAKSGYNESTSFYPSAAEIEYNQAYSAAYRQAKASSDYREIQLALDIDEPELMESLDKSMDSDSTVTHPEQSAVPKEFMDAELRLQQAEAEELLETKLLERELVLREEFESSQQNQIKAQTQELEASLSETRVLAEEETALRVETETHLRITRKALARLEAQTRDSESMLADELIALEQQLEDKIKENSIATAAAQREEDRRIQLEKELVDTKQSVLEARKDARKNTAARAKVLVTANKSIAFARQNVEARARTEAELADVVTQMNNQQQTISSLIKALEAEKAKSKEEISYLAKQLLLREKELEYRSDGVSRKTENLTSRLVKKVARAKPLVQ